MTEKPVKATVQWVNLHGLNGPFAQAEAKSVRGTITFSLDSAVWEENSVPQKGTVVLLTEFQKIDKKGWRAMSARLFRLSDETSELQKQDGESDD